MATAFEQRLRRWTPFTPRPKARGTLASFWWNARQRAALPLFVQAGLEDHLVQVGVLVDRSPDHQLQRVVDLNKRLAELHEACRARAEVWR